MLKELIDKFYLDGQKNREQLHFYVTDAGRCPRSIFFKFKNVSREAIEANVLRMFDHGDYIHQMIMKPLLGIRDIHVVASEVNIPTQEIISGRADAIISSGKELFVLDIKSMNSMIFKNLAEPKAENVDQIQLYLHYFKIPKGILLYVNKDNQHLKEFIVDYDEKRADSLIKGLESLKEKIDGDIVPNRISSYPKDWQCRYCQFRDICAIAGGEDIKWREFRDRIELREENIRTI